MNDQLRRLKPFDGTVFHYCSTESFVSILDSRTIRLSDISGLNDYVEYQAVQLMFKGILIQLKDDGYDPSILLKIQSILSAYTPFAFVACFSKSSDKLSQWRAYAADGKGFAIGFSFRKDRFTLSRPTFFMGESLQYSLNEMRYPENGFDSERRQLYQTIKHLWNENQSNPLPVIVEWLLCEITRLKHPGFSEEREVRIASVPTIFFSPIIQGVVDKKLSTGLPHLKFYTKNGIIRTYVDFAFDSSEVTHITIGPKNITNKSVVREYLNSRGYTSVNVTESLIPYR